MKTFITVSMTLFCVIFGVLAYFYYLSGIELDQYRMYGGLLAVMAWSLMPTLFFTLGVQYNK